MYHKY